MRRLHTQDCCSLLSTLAAISPVSTNIVDSLPPDWALNLSDALSDYILSVFQEMIGPDDPDRPMVLPAPTLPVPLVAECEHAAAVLATAFRNTGAL